MKSTHLLSKPYSPIAHPVFRACAPCLLLLITACGDSNSVSADNVNANPNPPTSDLSQTVANEDLSAAVSPELTLVSAGSEPVRQLSVSENTARLFNVDVSRSLDLSIDNQSNVQESSASYDLRTDLITGDDSVELDMIPVVKSLVPSPQPMPSAVPGAWHRTYSLQGELLESRSTDTDGLFTLNTDGIFILGGLLLAVPNVPVGVGANWYFDNEQDGVTLRTRVTIKGINESVINTTSQTWLLSTTKNQLDTYSATSTIAYNTNSLLVTTMDATRAMSYTTNQNKNNKPVTIVGTWQSTETIRENAQ